MTDTPEAKALGVLRSKAAALEYLEPYLPALVEVFAAAVKRDAAEVALADALTDDEIKRASKRLILARNECATAIANLTGGVLNNG